MSQTTAPASETFGFEAEVARLLKMMVHSVYSEREIFLRELISNASDACDRLRHAAQIEAGLLGEDPDFHIEIRLDPHARTLSIADNGIGMNRDDLIDNLGTIARSGTARFLESLKEAKKPDLNLIGQFGIGFYAVFMVADKVEVLTRKAGEDKAWLWISDGEGAYQIAAAEKPGRGTRITLHLKDDAQEFNEKPRLERIVRTYSDHIATPIRLAIGAEDAQPVNSGTALWTRPKSDIDAAQYAEFYRHVAGAFDEPALTLHFHAEGRIDYRALLFIPSMPPFDLFDPARRGKLKLYVKRVFITDDCEELLPGYLRFVRGIVDSQDLALNISREMLQNNPILAAMRKAIVNKLLAELKKTAEKTPEDYLKIWEHFGKVLKEGLYEDGDRREELLKLSRFRSTKAEGWTSLDDYIGRMADKQDAIYIIRGDNLEALKSSPQIEGFRARDIEVLLLTDPIDDFWVDAAGLYDGKPIKSVTRGAADLKDLGKKPAERDQAAPPPAADTDKLIAALKAALGDKVKDVRLSDRLTDSAVCLVADEGGLDMHLERILRQHDQLPQLSPRILEINAAHGLIRALAAKAAAVDGAAQALEPAAFLLLDQARILEGETIPDPNAFAQRMTALLARVYG